MPRKVLWGILAIVGVVILIWLLLVRLNQDNLNGINNANNNNQQQNQTNNDAQMSPTAKTYTSDALGITFTYDSKPAETFEVKVTERGNKIYVHGTQEQPEQGKVIEVFTKDPSLSLKQAIEQQFLRNYSQQNCFVEEISQVAEDPRPDSYVFAEISYPAPTDPNQPFWQNAPKCPQPYSKTNAVQYFMMDNNVPSKFVFVILGQDSITSDGIVRADGQRQDWSGSIRIVR